MTSKGVKTKHEASSAMEDEGMEESGCCGKMDRQVS